MNLFFSILIFLSQNIIYDVGSLCDLDNFIKSESKREYFSTWKKFREISNKSISTKRNTGHVRLIYLLKKDQNILRFHSRRITHSEGFIKNSSKFKKKCDKIMKEMLPELQLMVDESKRNEACNFLVYRFNIHYCI